MYLKKLLTGLVLALVTTSCVSAEKQEGVDSPGKPGVLTIEDVQNVLTKDARRVFVMFSKLNGHTCPADVQALDRVCNGAGYMVNDTSIICRVAGDNVGNTPIQKIVWKSEDDITKFKVTFPGFSGGSPCRGNWDGGTAEKVHVCNLKRPRNLKLGQDDAAYIKYDISVDDPDCPVLDPYFIVRK